MYMYITVYIYAYAIHIYMITKPSIVLKLPFLWPLLPCSPETPWLAEECHPRRQRGPGFLLENPLVSPKTCHVKWEKMEKMLGGTVASTPRNIGGADMMRISQI
jgi:hypothetical protein